MKRLGLILIGLLGAATVGLQGQTNQTAQQQTGEILQWTTIKPSDFKDSMVYKTLGDFDGKNYEAIVYGRDFDGVTKWKPGDELPFGMPKITANAQNAFQKQFPQFSQFKIVSVNLVHLPAVDDWVFDVEFNGTDFAKQSPGSFEDKKINVIVLLNGRAITPTETAK